MWQTALITTGIYLVLQDWPKLAISVAVALVSMVSLKFFWYDRMVDYPPMPAGMAVPGDGGAGEADLRVAAAQTGTLAAAAPIPT